MDIDHSSKQYSTARDLLWATQGPQLLSPEGLPSSISLHSVQANFEIFSQLQRTPERLTNYCAQQNTRLVGTYFEALWRFYLSQHSNVKQLLNNVQIFNQQKHTIGEFDLLYEDIKLQHAVHQELAFKVYLGNPCREYGEALNHPSRWIGPNCKDRLDIKLNKLLSHQLQLSLRPEAQDLLQKIAIPYQHLQCQLTAMGILFYPAFHELPPPTGSSSNHQQGQWVSEEQLVDFLDQQPYQHYVNKPKSTWISPLVAHRDQCNSAQELRTHVTSHFKTKQYPLLIAALSPLDAEQTPTDPLEAIAHTYGFSPLSDPEQQLLEVSRFFVVPNNWPFSFQGKA